MAHSLTGPVVLSACTAAPAPREPQPTSATFNSSLPAAWTVAGVSVTSAEPAAAAALGARNCRRLAPVSMDESGMHAPPYRSLSRGWTQGRHGHCFEWPCCTALTCPRQAVGTAPNLYVLAAAARLRGAAAFPAFFACLALGLAGAAGCSSRTARSFF